MKVFGHKLEREFFWLYVAEFFAFIAIILYTIKFVVLTLALLGVIPPV
jgi:hypothetical protein